ncbi:protein kinase domain-containing protein [Lacipirellula limnantheis]|uniref:Serine/threonine-protein kinase PknB n=1 Tax=Lacipirellula limnantheis TaxID=2528024 RepID=A0A517TXM9_9BACT|nr:protein kinase [Lacipirellula limnantheis]QDT73134.1 Serine/threonine-protein kinase PknB [Lacipirellula limnantheis]
MLENTRQATASFSQFVDNAVASGLLPDDELASLVAVANGDPEELSRLVSDKGLLTRFQLAALNEGRGDSLRIGNYDILDRLGAGGMGTVFKARHRRMKRIVALKVLAENLSENPLFVKRFQREVETIAALGHPNVVMAYDADEAEAGHFLVMEFVNGRDLAACLEREGTFALSRAVDCILQAARGLAYAHAQAIVHRDVKPHNLLLDESGVIKVTDLGLARLNHGAAGAAAGADVTMAGGVIGTVDYMSPEQAIDSTTIDHRADIYSLGCTLHYLLTGGPPYRGATIMEILLKHRDGEIPRLRAARAESPPQLDDLFRRMLSKTPEERVQQMSDVVAELEAIAAILPKDPERGATRAMLELPSELNAASTIDIATMPPSTLPIASKITPLTVLVVEPSRVQATIIKNFLQERSLFVVGAVSSGKAAIEAVRSLRPQVVISAMHLSDINGVELAQQIREEIRINAPGFVLVTSEANDGESAELSKLNRVLLLPKPFTAEQMVQALNMVTGASMPLQAAACSGAFHPLGEKKDRRELRVLIADDSSTARIHVRTVLQGLGFTQFLKVPDGAHAIAIAARESCDLIVTDYNMPLMDGRALVSYLKQNPATSSIPVMMVTTETDPRVLDPVRQLGVVAIFEKAFPSSEVGPILDSLFG